MTNKKGMRTFALTLLIAFLCIEQNAAQTSVLTRAITVRSFGAEAIETLDSVGRIFELNAISKSKEGTVFLAGHKIGLRKNEKGHTVLVKISPRGKLQVKKLAFSDEMREIFFADDRIGWLSGLKGIYQTSDGGKSWIRLEAPNTGALQMAFYNSSAGWVSRDSGNDNSLLKIVDTKIVATRPQNWNNIYKMQFADENNGWISESDYGSRVVGFHHSEDGANTWTDIAVDNGILFDFHFLNSLRGYSITSKAVYATEDGGKSWKFLRANSPPHQYEDLFFLNEKEGWILGKETCSTSDAGHNWKCFPFPADASNNHTRKFVLSDSKKGWLLTSGGLFSTKNGGKNWKRRYVNLDGSRF